MAKRCKLMCKHCGKEFFHTNNMKSYCSDECKLAHKAIGVCVVCGKEFAKYSKRQNTCSHECHAVLHRRQMSENGQKILKNRIGSEGYDYVTCAICGAHLKQFNDKHLEMHGITREEYVRLYGDIQYSAIKHIENTLMGDNNPNSKSKTTPEERRRRSPYSLDFYTSRGMSIAEYKKFLESRSTAAPSFVRSSKVSQELFDAIHDRIKHTNLIESYHTHNGELSIPKESGWSYFVDYAIKELMFMIEFNGNSFHADIDRMNESEISSWRNCCSGEDAASSYEHDKMKIEYLKSLGYVVKVVWESDYKKDPDTVVDECVKEIMELYEKKRS